jgi:hypothetical protein
MFLVPLFLISAALAAGHPDFKKDAHSVSWKGHKIPGADPKTFEAPCPAEFEERKGNAAFCAADAKSVFLGREQDKFSVNVVARDLVKPLGKNHFQIGRTVFYKDLMHPLERADFATFDELEEANETGIDSRRQWAADHRDVYCAGQVVTGLSPKDLEFWPFLSWDCKDLVPSQAGSAVPATGYIKDDGGVFVYVDCKLEMRLPDADPATFTVPSILFPSRARDGKGHLYNCGSKVSRKKSAR